MQLNTRKKKKSNLIKKWVENLIRHFSKEDIQMVNKHIKRCSIPLIIREMQIKTTKRCHFTLIRMTIIKNLQTINAAECGEKGMFLHRWWEYKLIQPPWRIVWRFLTTRNKTII